MARPGDVRPVVEPRSSAGTGDTFVTRRNRRDDPGRLTPGTFEPVVRHHVDVETR